MQFPIEAKLKDETPVELVLAGNRDLPLLAKLYDRIVAEGTSYPHERPLTEDEFQDYWVRGKSTVVAYERSRKTGAELLGAFYLRPNWPGRARTVANAGFIVAPEWRNRGLGWLLGAVMLDYAKELGYRSVIFNLVFSENQVARHLWEKLGFRVLGVIPSAVRKNDATYQDALIMFRSLVSPIPQAEFR
ncbi:MAG: GNAT family N-acetyltransferase [Nitrospirae bacterium]|nr:GNAT family N-acetyltransferase [Nitrospirota bacterium]